MGTVRGNCDKLRMGTDLSALVGLSGGFVHKGPMPIYDHCGYKMAIQMLLYSRRPGKEGRSYLQAETIRKLRSSYSNQRRFSPQTTVTTLVMGDQRGRYSRVCDDPCASLFFYRIVEGMKHWKGSDYHPNRGMSIDLLLAILSDAEDRIAVAPSREERHRWIVFHVFLVVTCAVSLRGPEGFLLDLDGMN